jgi:predicted RNase H-like HicB family nuclease
MTNYIALIRRDPDGEYSVAFPDFPGCSVTAQTLDAARRRAALALAAHIDDVGLAGEGLPEPTSIDLVMGDPGNRDAMACLIPITEAALNAVQVNITLPEGVLDRIDAFARRHNTNRSAFLTRAALHAMREAAGTSDAIR